MAVQLSFQFDDVNQAATFLEQLQKPSPIVSLVKEAMDAVGDAPLIDLGKVADEVAANQPKRRGRPPKAAAQDPTPQIGARLVEATTPAEPITQEQAMAKFKQLNDVAGLVACKTVLTKFNAARFGMVNPEQYAEFVAKCDEVIAGAKAA